VLGNKETKPLRPLPQDREESSPTGLDKAAWNGGKAVNQSLAKAITHLTSDRGAFYGKRPAGSQPMAQGNNGREKDPAGN
jgi:hypothetical protein